MRRLTIASIGLLFLAVPAFGQTPEEGSSQQPRAATPFLQEVQERGRPPFLQDIDARYGQSAASGVNGGTGPFASGSGYSGLEAGAKLPTYSGGAGDLRSLSSSAMTPYANAPYAYYGDNIQSPTADSD